MADCNDTIARLYVYLDRFLDDELRLEIDEHLRVCPDCQGRLEFEHTLKLTIRERSREEPVDEELRQRLLDCFEIDLDDE
ncbi:MAG: putative zinc-finger [Actinomycetota bacterium]|jgi:mycothiol system anti-sigma-R factor